MTCIDLRRFSFKSLMAITFLTGECSRPVPNSEVVRATVLGCGGKDFDSRIGFPDRHGSDRGQLPSAFLRVFSAFFLEQFFVGLGEEFG